MRMCFVDSQHTQPKIFKNQFLYVADNKTLTEGSWVGGEVSEIVFERLK